LPSLTFLKSVVSKDVRVRLPPSAQLLISRFPLNLPLDDLNPKSEDGAKMVTLFELNQSASRFCEFVYCIFQPPVLRAYVPVTLLMQMGWSGSS
jgi:hypothetical protein